MMRNFLKNNLRIILVAGITAIICISGTVLAAYQYNANQIEYKNGKTVEQALNELYSNRQSNNEYGFFSYGNIENRYGLNKYTPSQKIINIKMSENNGANAIVLKKGVKYNISFSSRVYCASTFNFEYGLYDVINNTFLLSDKKENITSSWDNYSFTQEYTPNEDQYIVYATNMSGSGYCATSQNKLAISNNSTYIGKVNFNGNNVGNNLTIKDYDNSSIVENNKVKLSGNKNYRIKYQVKINPGNEYGNYSLYNYTDNTTMNFEQFTYGAGNIETQYEILYHTTKDILIGVSSAREGGGTNAMILEGTYISIEEL